MKAKPYRNPLPLSADGTTAHRMLPGNLKPHANGSAYGSSVSMEDVIPLIDESMAVPPVNKIYVQSIATIHDGSDGETRVRNYHSRLFLEHISELLTRCTQLRDQLQSDLAGIERHIAELSGINDRTARYQEQTGATLPWTRFAGIQVTILAVFSLLLLAVGINTTAQVLLASGIPGFENPWRCYLFSLIPIGIAFGLKYLRFFIPAPAARTAYAVFIWIAGILSGFIWSLLFAKTFPGLTQSTADIINSLATATNNAPGGPSGPAMIVVSIVAESLLAAGCWLTIEDIFGHHQPPLRVDSPAFQKTQRDLDHWLRRHYEQDELLGKVQGKLGSIEEAKQRLMEEAASYFRVAVAAAANAERLNSLFNR